MNTICEPQVFRCGKCNRKFMDAIKAEECCTRQNEIFSGTIRTSATEYYFTKGADNNSIYIVVESGPNRGKNKTCYTAKDIAAFMANVEDWQVVRSMGEMIHGLPAGTPLSEEWWLS